jgi:hypothetical protein
MADRIIVYWRDIPAQIIIKSGRKTAKRELSERFVQTIDRCAMRIGARDSDAYLAEWRRGSPESCGDDLEAEADATLARLENEYGTDRLRQLVDNGGREA